MSFTQAFLLGIVEGVTEFLPISSTAHLILASSLLSIKQTEFQKSFEIIIQFGAILAVVALYWRYLINLDVLKRLIVAFIPTGIIGLILYPFVKKTLLGNIDIVLWSLLIGGILLIIFENIYEEKENAMDTMAAVPFRRCLYIGLFQAIAIVPGVSRSAATIIGGLLLGFKRKTIVEFSFLLAVPTMMAATGMDLLSSAGGFSWRESSLLLVGFVTSFVMAIIGIKFLLAFVQNRSFQVFGIYRIILASLFFLR